MKHKTARQLQKEIKQMQTQINAKANRNNLERQHFQLKYAKEITLAKKLYAGIEKVCSTTIKILQAPRNIAIKMKPCTKQAIRGFAKGMQYFNPKQEQRVVLLCYGGCKI